MLRHQKISLLWFPTLRQVLTPINNTKRIFKTARLTFDSHSWAHFNTKLTSRISYNNAAPGIQLDWQYVKMWDISRDDVGIPDGDDVCGMVGRLTSRAEVGNLHVTSLGEAFSVVSLRAWRFSAFYLSTYLKCNRPWRAQCTSYPWRHSLHESKPSTRRPTARRVVVCTLK